MNPLNPSSMVGGVMYKRTASSQVIVLVELGAVNFENARRAAGFEKSSYIGRFEKVIL